MKKSSQEKFVTVPVFVREIGRLDKNIDHFTENIFVKEISRLDDKIDNLALAVLKNSENVQEIKETMASKDDVNLILDRIDAFTKRIDTYDKKTIVQDFRLSEHEKRISALEAREK